MLCRLFWLVWGMVVSLSVAAQYTTDAYHRVRVRDTMQVPAKAVFDQFTWEQGLPKGNVHSLYRDRRGFLWMSVAGSGINRFDGQESHVYPTVADDTTGGFPALYFYAADEDSHGSIWFATEKGLVRYDPVSDTFELIRRPDGGNDYSSLVEVDSRDRVWVSYTDGIWRYVPSQHQLEKVVANTMKHAFSGRTVMSTEPQLHFGLIELGGDIWISCYFQNSKQLAILRNTLADDVWMMYPTPAATDVYYARVEAVDTQGGHIWISDWNTGVWVLDIKKQAWTQYDLTSVGCDDTFTSVVADGEKGNFWFTTIDGTTGYFEEATKTVSKYHFRPGDRTSPLGLRTRAGAFRDRDNTIWWSSEKGIYALHARRQWLSYSFSPQSRAHHMQEEFETMLYDTVEHCLFTVRRVSDGVWEVFRLDDDGGSRSAIIRAKGKITCMARIRDDIWIGHMGLSRVHPRTLQLQHTDYPIENGGGLRTDSLDMGTNAVVLPDGGACWATGNGILYREPTRGKFYLLATDPRATTFPDGSGILMLQSDRHGHVWVASRTGVWKLRLTPSMPAGRKPTYTSEHFFITPSDSLNEAKNFAVWVTPTDGDTVWVFTSLGLFLIPPGAKACQPVRKVQVYCTRGYPDSFGNIWFKTFQGIGRYNPNLDRYDVIDERDGILGGNYDRLYRAPTGEFFFRGSYRWWPNNPLAHSQPPRPTFTGFKIFERDFPLDTVVDFIHTIKLRAAQNFFSISFAALHFTRPDKNEYAYRLVGVDADWVYVGNRNTASYTNLRPGHYTFMLKAANNDGIWSAPRSVNIEIAPEWYQTLLFKLCCLLGLLGLAYLFLRFRVREATLTANLRSEKADREKAEEELLRREAEFRRRLAETEMAALRAQMNPHFIFNCLNSIKLYTEENNSETASYYLTKFARLIRRVLENSRSEKVTLADEVAALELYIEMEAMRFKNKVRYHIHIADEVDTHFIQIPPLIVQPFVENAIWHGLMHKLEGGNIYLRFHIKDQSTLCIDIEDDGIGRALAAQYKSKSAQSQKSFGMQVTAERMAAINQLYQIESRTTIHDLTDAQGQPRGTLVILEIPI